MQHQLLFFLRAANKYRIFDCDLNESYIKMMCCENWPSINRRLWETEHHLQVSLAILMMNSRIITQIYKQHTIKNHVNFFLENQGFRLHHIILMTFIEKDSTCLLMEKNYGFIKYQ